MQIIVVGCGNVGTTLVEQLSKEDHNITVIDQNGDNVQYAVNTFDVMGIVGNGASYEIQTDAGVAKADLLIAVTSADEVNLLCCLIAKKAGDCKTIARVRNPVYRQEVTYIREELGLSMIINPEEAAAAEAVRMLKFPSAAKVELLARGRAEMVTLIPEDDSPLLGKPLHQLQSELKSNVLVCVATRGDDVIIPNGNFVPQVKDELTLIGASKNMISLFKKLHLPTTRVHSTMIIGGGSTGYYLAKQLLALGIDVRIFERDKARCKELSIELPDALIINGEGINRDMLMEEGLPSMESFVTLTGVDEENIMLSLYAKTVSKAKRITKIQHANYDEIIDTLDIGSVLYPKQITAERIVQYVRAMSNSLDSNIESLFRIKDGKAEVLEFQIRSGAPVTGKPLMELPMKKNVLLASIVRNNETISPSGTSEIRVGDRVIVVTTHSGFQDISDILE